MLGIIAALNIPLVHFSVVWWRTLHQPPSLAKRARLLRLEEEAAA